MGIERDHLLELVEDERDASVPLRREARRQLDEGLDRRVDVGDVVACAEREAEARVVRVDRDRRLDAQAAKEREPAFARADQRRRDVLVDRLGETRCQPLLRRGRHQVDVGDEDAPAQQLLDRTEHERRLPVPPRAEDHDVLAVAHVRDELRKLALAVGESLV